MKSIKYNSSVLLNYSLKGNDNLFESTFDKEPIRITIGKSKMPQIIEASLYGLKLSIYEDSTPLAQIAPKLLSYCDSE